MNGYHPIPCALHSEYERLAVKRASVQIQWRDRHGQAQEADGHVMDVLTRAGEEFLVLRTGREQREIRLDRIESVTAV